MQRDMAEFFDDYVENVFPARRMAAGAAGAAWAWPGDEWAGDDMKRATFDLMMAAAGGAVPGEVIEIGPGSGKYTELLLARMAADAGSHRTAPRLTAYEISPAFIASLATRCAGDIAAGRLDPRLIDWTDNRSLIADYGARAGTADLFFAVDVFLMMDFQSVLPYLVSAAAMLRRGGRFFATFGDGASDSGWRRMLRDAGRHSAFDPAPSTRFHWIDRPLIEGVLRRLGFGAIAVTHGPGGDGGDGGDGPGDTAGLDVARLYVAAELVDPMPVADALAILAPAGDSTNRPNG